MYGDMGHGLSEVELSGRHRWRKREKPYDDLIEVLLQFRMIPVPTSEWCGIQSGGSLVGLEGGG